MASDPFEQGMQQINKLRSDLFGGSSKLGTIQKVLEGEGPAGKEQKIRSSIGLVGLTNEQLLGPWTPASDNSGDSEQRQPQEGGSTVTNGQNYNTGATSSHARSNPQHNQPAQAQKVNGQTVQNQRAQHSTNAPDAGTNTGKGGEDHWNEFVVATEAKPPGGTATGTGTEQLRYLHSLHPHHPLRKALPNHHPLKAGDSSSMPVNHEYHHEGKSGPGGTGQYYAKGGKDPSGMHADEKASCFYTKEDAEHFAAITPEGKHLVDKPWEIKNKCPTTPIKKSFAGGSSGGSGGGGGGGGGSSA